MDKVQSAQQVLTPIVKSIAIALPVEAAFRLFTDQAGRWWPLPSHSVGGENAATCILEGWTGGRFYEVDRDGQEFEWGRVLAWEPSQRAVLSFYPGRTADTATEVEIVFEPDGSGSRLTLIHRGWEHCAPIMQAERQNYEQGWDYVLGKYIAFTGIPA